MKKNRIANLILLTSLAFFTACSDKTPDVAKPKLTALDIMGIDVTTKKAPRCTPSIDSLPLARTYPILESSPIVEAEVRGCITDVGELRQTDEPRNLVNNIEWNAKQLLGLKYVWGATGPYNYDCSGFTQKIFRDAGIRIPRVSRDQAKVGQYVSFNQLQRGDMVFFDTKKHPLGKVTHVGIYLGNGNFIHASSAAKKIVIFNWNKKKFYKRRFLWGRRVIQDNTHFASL
jgi:cell wall-associated NlpC family hydrolase